MKISNTAFYPFLPKVKHSPIIMDMYPFKWKSTVNKPFDAQGLLIYASYTPNGYIGESNEVSLEKYKVWKITHRS